MRKLLQIVAVILIVILLCRFFGTNIVFSSGVSAIAVSGSDIYIMDDRFTLGGNVRYIWKNNTLVSKVKAPYAQIVGGKIIDNDFYTFGKTGVWKNGYDALVFGEKIQIQDIAINNGDIYAVGFYGDYINGDFKGYVWHNNDIKYSLGRGVDSITVKNDGIYTSGITGGGVIWRNDSPIYEEKNAYIFDSTIVGNDIYYAGSSSQKSSRAAVWKNGKLLYEGDYGSVATNINVCNNNVYTLGHIFIGGYKEYMLWKNGQIIYDNLQTNPIHSKRGSKDVACKFTLADDCNVYYACESGSKTLTIYKNGTIEYLLK